jgi:predicted acylesterase/phospholipase RssA
MKAPVEALVLSGNASYAAYEVGVSLALFSGQSAGVGFKPLQPLILSGTSAGGINAALLATLFNGDFLSAGRDLEQIWLRRIGRTPGDCDASAYRVRGLALFNPECLVEQPLKTLAEVTRDTAYLAGQFFQRAVQMVRAKESVEQGLASGLDIGLFISPEPMHALIRETVSLSKLRHTQLRLRIAATNWRTGEARIFINSDFTDDAGHAMILASAAVPGIFPAVSIRGEPYVDGGIFLNTPLKPAIDAGADVLHVIYMEPDVGKMQLTEYENTLDAILRTRNIANAAIIASDLATAARENSTLAAMGKFAVGQRPSSQEMYEFARAASQINQQLLQSKMPRRLTIHCYHPVNVLGGELGFANFNSGAIRQMIDRGFADARSHDCKASGCVIPAGVNGR